MAANSLAQVHSNLIDPTQSSKTASKTNSSYKASRATACAEMNLLVPQNHFLKVAKAVPSLASQRE